MRSRRSRIGIGMLAAVTMLMVSCGSDDDGGAAPDESVGSGATTPGAAPTSGGEAPADAEPVTLSILHTTTPADVQLMGTLTARYTELHPNVTFEAETHPGGEEGDNLVKTKLATGEMNDIFYYNSGSLLQASALIAASNHSPCSALETVSDVSCGCHLWWRDLCVPAGPGSPAVSCSQGRVCRPRFKGRYRAEFSANNEKSRLLVSPDLALRRCLDRSVFTCYYTRRRRDPDFTEP